MIVKENGRLQRKMLFSIIWKGPIKLTPEAEKIIIQKLTFIRTKEFLSFLLSSFEPNSFQTFSLFLSETFPPCKSWTKIWLKFSAKENFSSRDTKAQHLLTFSQVRFPKSNLNLKFYYIETFYATFGWNFIYKRLVCHCYLYVYEWFI